MSEVTTKLNLGSDVGEGDGSGVSVGISVGVAVAMRVGTIVIVGEANSAIVWPGSRPGAQATREKTSRQTKENFFIVTSL